MSFITRATPYFIQCNSHGSLPVYTNVRNGGTKYLVTIRNVQGQLNSLANDLKKSLFSHNSPEANRLKVQAIAQRHLVIMGGRWKNDVISWLTSKGFYICTIII
ncbi:ribosomal protein L49/IMG2 [Suillus fuscotomentosus]|uniref:Large ribosomal subunit protein mL49 n=1 Tax=Suillus fuscotomentosus TaxID=1912939 RepID=A0AAD4HMU4_9AGAM|nr:ribosomal protein L49/IMG2 [Suillus fuscotomentosus]KAG1902458.1 ribosomal protein L49/IMG2 [Suillus fuscotomentosus]